MRYINATTGYTAALYSMRTEPVTGYGRNRITVTETLTLTLTLTLPMDVFCRMHFATCRN